MKVEYRAKARLATTHVDLHGDRFAKSALEGMVRQLSEAEGPQWMYMEHDTTLPPIGRVVGARLVQLEDGEYAVDGEIEIYSVDSYGGLAESEVDTTLSNADVVFQRSLLPEGPAEIEISYDPLNYGTEMVEQFVEETSEVLPVKTRPLIRKALTPLSILTVLIATPVSLFSKGFFTEMGKDAYGLLKKKLVKLVKSRKPMDTPALIFHLPMPELEIVVEGSIRSENDKVLIASADLVQRLHTVATALLRRNRPHFFSKVTYLLNPETVDWEINYLITRTGGIILGPSYKGAKKRMMRDWIRSNFGEEGKRTGMSSTGEVRL